VDTLLNAFQVESILPHGATPQATRNRVARSRLGIPNGRPSVPDSSEEIPNIVKILGRGRAAPPLAAGCCPDRSVPGEFAGWLTGKSPGKNGDSLPGGPPRGAPERSGGHRRFAQSACPAASGVSAAVVARRRIPATQSEPRGLQTVSGRCTVECSRTRKRP